MIKLVICDDDEMVVEAIFNMLEKNFGSELLLEKYHDPLTLSNFYLNGELKSLDILVMDIELNGDNGIRLAASLLRRYPNVKVIIFSGHINYVEEIFEVSPVQFLLKPVDEKRLVSAVRKSINFLESEKQSSISISNKKGIFNICLKDVKYFESNGRYIYIHGVNGLRKINYKLDDLAKVLPANFLRCHKSFSVNMDYIKEVSRDGILLFGRDMIPVSRSKNAVVKAEFLNYLGDRL